MADTVDSIVLESTPKRYIVRLFNVYVDTGESAVVKVDKSGLVASNGLEPRDLIIDEIEWAIQGYSKVTLLWEHDTDDEAVVLTGNGYANYWSSGGLKDPRSSGGTGDIVCTTTGAAAGNSYNITLNCRLQANG